MAKSAVEVYRSQTERIIRRFLRYRLTAPDCLAALDASLSRLAPKVPPGELDDLQSVRLAGNNKVSTEMERRGRRRARASTNDESLRNTIL